MSLQTLDNLTHSTASLFYALSVYFVKYGYVGGSVI